MYKWLFIGCEVWHKASNLDALSTRSYMGEVWRKILSEEIKPLKIFVGYDSREDIAFEVCKQSIYNTASVPVEVIPLKQDKLRKQGWYWRDEDKLGSTEFTFTRFLVPFLTDYTGWALFIDCDFIFKQDIADLFALADDKYAVMCAHHDYTPKEGEKMDGKAQLPYPRKNWSSMVLWNCGHHLNKKCVTLDLINHADTTALPIDFLGYQISLLVKLLTNGIG